TVLNILPVINIFWDVDRESLTLLDATKIYPWLSAASIYNRIACFPFPSMSTTKTIGQFLSRSKEVGRKSEKLSETESLTAMESITAPFFNVNCCALVI